MAENGRAPNSRPSPSERNSLEQSPMSFAPLSGGSGVSATGGYMISLPNTNNSNTNNNNNLMPPPPPLPPPSGGYRILPPEVTRDVVPTNSASKRPRGRPPGSKNKPKPPTVIVREDKDSLLKPIVIEIPSGKDVVESLINVARRRQVGISVLSGMGSVTDIVLRQPMSRATTYPIHGPFRMVSIAGTYVNPSIGRVPPQFLANPPCSSFSIYLSGSRGVVFGGVVGGKVMASSTVIVTATLFKRPEFYRVALVNGKIEEVFQGGGDNPNHPRVYPGVVINADHHQPNGIANNNTNNNNNTVAAGGAAIVSAFGAAANANSNQMNRKLATPPPAAPSPPPPVAADANVMQWKHYSTRTDN